MAKRDTGMREIGNNDNEGKTREQRDIGKRHQNKREKETGI